MTAILADATSTVIDLGLPSIIASLAGVLIGWQLTVHSAAKARREEWRRAEERAIETRLRDMAEELDDVIADVEAAVRGGRWKGLEPMAPSQLLDGSRSGIRRGAGSSIESPMTCSTNASTHSTSTSLLRSARLSWMTSPAQTSRSSSNSG